MSIEPGRLLGHYQLGHVLGAGGMGTVYRAYDVRLQRDVALKLIQPAPGVDTVGRLLAEARAASGLNHPNVCTIHDVVEHDGQAFIVMEYIEGLPLSSRLAEGALAAAAALDIALQVSAAVQHAHERGVVHGDLKAQNVLLTPSGRIKVVDFGLARRRAPDDSQTQTVTTTGTPYAMAPEQLRGSAPDARSDVWALGVLLQEVFSGTRPFERATLPELFAAILHEAPTPPALHLPPAIRRVIERCLLRDPAQRYQRAGEVLAALDAISDRGPAVQAPAGPPIEWVAAVPPALLAANHGAFVGRETEIDALRTAWHRARGGRRQLVLLSGEPGIGKSRLVGEFAASLDGEASVLFGRCDREALIPLQPFVEALQWYARQAPVPVIDQHLAAVDDTTELARLVPALARRAPRTPEPIDPNPESQRYRLFEAVAALVSAMAEGRPVLLALDDLHWADRPTVLLLRHLLRSSHDAALCITAAYRESELGRTHPLADVLGDLRQDPSVTRITLRGLDERSLGQLIERLTSKEADPRVARRIADATEGNPFFAGEVLRHLSDTGALEELAPGGAIGPVGLPEGVREAIGQRLARLSELCNRVLALAALVGREFTLPVLEAVAELPGSRVLDAVEEALAARLIQAVPGAPERFAFTHVLVREALYAELTPARRVRLHRAVAEALERLSAGGDPPLADLAYHYAEAASAADVHKAIDYAERAAAAAAATFAHEEAARFYQQALQALDLLPRSDGLRAQRRSLHARRARALTDVGLWAAARPDLEAALALVDPGDETRRAELLLDLANCSFWLLDIPAVRRHASEALAIAGALGRDDLLANALSWIASALNSEGDVPGAIALDRQAIALLGGPRTFGLARAVISLYHNGRLGEALDRARESLESARATRDPTFLVFALSHLAIALTGAGQYAEACQVFEQMRDCGRRHGALPMLARGIAMYGGLHLALGNYPRADELAYEASDLARRVGFAPAAVSAGIDQLLIHARSGNPGRAEPILDHVAAAVAASSGWHGWLWRLRLHEARAELALARAAWGEARDAATLCINDSRARARPKYIALGLIRRAQAAGHAGDVTSGLQDANEAAAIARMLGDPVVLLSAIAVLLELEGTDQLLAEGRACAAAIDTQLNDPLLRSAFAATPGARAVGLPAAAR